MTLNDQNTTVDLQLSFLEEKLIQTHQKLIEEIEHSKSLQAKHACAISHYSQKISQLQHQNSLLLQQIEDLRLQSLRTMTQKNQTEDTYKKRLQQIKDQTEKHAKDRLQTQIKDRQQLQSRHTLVIQRMQRDITVLKQRTSKAENQLFVVRKNQNFQLQKIKLLTERNQGLEQQLNQHKREAINLQQKLDIERNVVSKLKSDLAALQTNYKNQSRSFNEAIDTLNLQLINLKRTSIEKQKEIEDLKQKIYTEQKPKKKQNIELMKEFVQKLEHQQQQKLATRAKSKPPFSDLVQIDSVKNLHHERSQQTYRIASPKENQVPTTKVSERSIKTQKETYNQVLMEVNEVEAQLLACNLSKKSIETQIYKIDNTKIKTKDLLSRRKKLQSDLSLQQKRISDLKSQLKQIKL